MKKRYKPWTIHGEGMCEPINYYHGTFWVISPHDWSIYRRWDAEHSEEIDAASYVLLHRTGLDSGVFESATYPPGGVWLLVSYNAWNTEMQPLQADSPQVLASWPAEFEGDIKAVAIAVLALDLTCTNETSPVIGFCNSKSIVAFAPPTENICFQPEFANINWISSSKSFQCKSIIS